MIDSAAAGGVTATKRHATQPEDYSVNIDSTVR
jgi:hypothetical protein